MKILAHRGYWLKEEEKNSLTAFERALTHGFGVEIDIRDYQGNIVVSHNIADEKCIRLEEYFQIYQNTNSKGLLAINVKADGIQELLKPLIINYGIKNYFLFDMSVPELVVNEKQGLPFYTRQSDIEHHCVQYDSADGVWLDSFYDEKWLTEEILRIHIKNNKNLCMVSPELHGRNYQRLWENLKAGGFYRNSHVSLCTDYPEEAEGFFL